MYTTPTKQKTVNDLLYSLSAAARILGISHEEIEKLQVWHNGIWVKVIGKRPQIISKDIFKKHFVDWRKSRTGELIAVKDEKVTPLDTWDVYNPCQETWNRLRCYPYQITCTCEDWENQKRLLPMACCSPRI